MVQSRVDRTGALLAGLFLRWVPIPACWVVDTESALLVAQATGVTHSNVSMPLCGIAQSANSGRRTGVEA